MLSPEPVEARVRGAGFSGLEKIDEALEPLDEESKVPDEALAIDCVRGFVNFTVMARMDVPRTDGPDSLRSGLRKLCAGLKA